MKNIIFFNTTEYEQEYFTSHLGGKFNLIFDDTVLLENCKISDKAANAEIISVFTSCRLTKDILKNFKNLKLIATRSVGYSHIDTDYCKENNIKVVNTPHYGDYTVAEFSFAILLNLARKVSKSQSDLRAGDILSQKYEGIEFYNKIIGIIGTGGIGSKAIKIATGFSMTVLAYDIYPNEELERKFNIKYVDLNSLLRESDIIALYAPATKENYHLLDEEEFNKMKEGVIILNSARGELINTKVLYEALLSKKVAGAALDVLEAEEVIMQESSYALDEAFEDVSSLKKTLLNHKLLSLPNVLITPHIAYDTREAVNRILEMTVKNILEFDDNLQGTNIVV